MFLLFFSLILTALASFKTTFFDSYLGFLLFVAPRSSWTSVINFLQLVNLVFPVLIQNECKPIPEAYNHMSLPMATNLRFYRFLLICFYPLPYMKVLIFSVSPSTYSGIYTEKYVLSLGKF